MNADRRNIMLGTAGHVDHGKSALVKLLTGCETDTLAEEKERGLTIDLGFAPCRLADQRIVGIVDVPGHVDFIRNMVAGAQGIDVVILVVAADDGIMPQTHEHLHILTLMGLRHGLIALTKVDLVEAAWRDRVREELKRLLAGTFLADAPVCPVSNVTGEGYEDFFAALNGVVGQCEDRPCSGLFRLWVEDVFTIHGSGTVVTGIPVSGRVRAGDVLGLQPAGSSARVRRMQVYGRDAIEGRAGECVALNLPELDHHVVRRGMVLSDANTPPATTIAEAELRILEFIKGRLKDYVEVQLHVGTAAAPVHLAMLETTEMTGGQKQMVQLRLAEPLPIAPGDRFVIRGNIAASGVSGLTTLGGGQILGASNARLPRKKLWVLERLRARCEAVGDSGRWCEQMLRENLNAAPPAELQRKCWLPAGELVALLERLQAEGRAVPTAEGAWLHRDSVRHAADKILDAVESFHAADPQRAGIGQEELADVVRTDRGVVRLAVDWLLNEKQLERSGNFLARAGWSARLPERDQRLCDQLAARLRQAGCAPPSLEELVAHLHEPASRVAAMLRLLAERGIIVRLDDRVGMHRDAVEAGKQAVLRLFRKAASYSTMDFRDELGVSRKYAVPLADYLDRIRFTVRSGHTRTPGLEARKLLTGAATGKEGIRKTQGSSGPAL